MKIVRCSLTLGSFLLSGLATFAAEPLLETQISGVTIYADRALVQRSGELALKPGTQSVVIRELPAWLDTGSLRARVEPAQAGEIIDVQVEREFLARAKDADVRAAEKSLQEITDKLDELKDEMTLLAARKEQVEQISRFTMEKLPRDAVTREISAQHYHEVITLVAEELSALAARKRALIREQRELGPEQQVRGQRLADLQRQARLEYKTIRLTLKASAAGDANVAVSYLLPGATWEPVHEVRLPEAGDEVQWTSYARITQTTGEDWAGVLVSLSTQSPSKPVQIPELEALLVGSANARRLFEPQGGGHDTFALAQASYIAGNEYMNVQAGKAIRQQDYRSNLLRQQEIQTRVSQQFVRIQKRRGTTAVYEALSPTTLRSDGNPVRVPIGSATMAGRERIIAAPEISLSATRTLDLTHAEERPLLPGSVAIFRHGAFIGTTEIDFVGAGETFPLFAGLTDDLKLSREMDRKVSKLDRGRKTNKMVVAFDVTIENLSEHSQSVRLADRIPVSDDRDIRVSSVRISPTIKPDTDGLLLWDLVVPAQGEVAVRIAYTVEYPIAIVRSKSSIAPSRAVDQIMDLEMKF